MHKLKAGKILIDTGAARSMIHKNMLRTAKYKISRPIDKIYCGAGGNTLNVSPHLVDVEVNIDGLGPFVFKDVIVSLSPKETDTMLLGSPDIVRMGIVLDYDQFKITLKKGKYKTAIFDMTNFKGQKVAEIADFESANQDQAVHDLFDDWFTIYALDADKNDFKNDFKNKSSAKIRSSEVQQSSNSNSSKFSSSKSVCGDPCMYHTQPCIGCDKCIDQKLKILIENEGPPTLNNPNVDGKTALMAYIERIRQKDRSTYTHNECTIDKELIKSDPELADKLRKLIEKHKNVFAGDIGKVSDTYAVKGKMVGKPSPQRPGHNDFHDQTLIAVLKQFSKLIAHGILVNVQDHDITPINKLNILPVKKKDDDGNILKVLTALRLVVDSRLANSQTLFCGSETDNLTNALHFAARTSKFGYNMKADIADAYYIIPLDKTLWPYFCVTIPILGTYCFTRLVQGWAPAAQWCQETLTRIFFPLYQYLKKYMDDLVLAVDNKKDYLTKIEHFFKICEHSGLRLKGKKCFFGVKTFNFLGYTISNGLITASPHYVLKLKDIKLESINLKTHLRSFVQSVAYLGKFSNHSTAMLQPLRDASKGEKKDKIEWSPKLIAAFQKVKLALDELSQLHPFDPKLDTILVVDTSKVATGGFLYQKGKNGPQLVQFFSRVRRDKERKVPLSSCHMELLGLKSMIIALLYLLRQCKRPITVISDSRSLVKIFEKFRKHDLPSHDTLLNNAVYAILSVLDVNVIHAKNTNVNIKFADDLSRLNILKSSEQCIGQPSCTICKAADPCSEDRGAFLNKIYQIDNFHKNYGNFLYPSMDDSEIKSDLITFNSQNFINPNYLLAVRPKEMNYNVHELLNDVDFIINLQNKDPTLKSLRHGLIQKKTSYPKRQQKLQTLLVNRSADIKKGYIQLDRVIDGITYRVIPLPPSAAIIAISAIHKTIGHQSVTQILKQTCRIFQFDSMRTKIQNFVSKCLKCTLLKGGQAPFLRTKQKPVPLPSNFYQTILVDEVTRTFRGKNIKFLMAMESLSGFITVLIYEKTMTGPKFIQAMAQIKSILCPHGLQGAKIAVRCDQATWHTSREVREALLMLNIDLNFYTSATLSKNIIPELDAKIKVFGQYLAQIVENDPWDLSTCCFAAAAKTNSAIGVTGYSAADLFVGRGWHDRKLIQIDTDKLLKDIAERRKERRNYEERIKLKKIVSKEKRLTPYKNDELNSPIIRNPLILRLKSGDHITIKEQFDKNQPRSGWLVLEVDFKNQKVKIQRDSGRDLIAPDVKTISFELIDKIFADSEKLQAIQEAQGQLHRPIISDMTSFLLKVLNCGQDIMSAPADNLQSTDDPQFFNNQIDDPDISNLSILKTPVLLKTDSSDSFKFLIN